MTGEYRNLIIMGIFTRHSFYRTMLTIVSIMVFCCGVVKGQTPTLSVSSPILSGFTYSENAGPSGVQSYNLSGIDLSPVSGDVTVSGSTNYEVSNDNLNFGPAIVISYSGGSFTDIPVYVRLKSGLIEGVYNGESISNSGSGASDVFVTCNGNITCAIPPTPTISAGGTTTFCSGENVSLTSSSGTSYLWSTGETTPSITIYISGIYDVKITNATGCQSLASTVIEVTVNNLPTANITGTASFCSGGNTLLTSNATAASGSITGYQWNLDGTPISGATAATYTATAAGSYTVTISNSQGCSFTSTDFVVTVNAFPEANITGTASFCAGGSTLLTSNATAGSGSITDYQWNLDGTPITGAIVATHAANAAGSYTVSITNSNGCAYTSSAVKVTVNDLPTANISGTASFCSGGNTLIGSNATAGSGSITDYQWNLDGTPVSGATAATYAATEAGSYTVTITNSNGCSFTSTALVVTINALPSANITGSTSFCIGENTLLTSNAIAGSGLITDYQWNLDGTPISGEIAATHAATVEGSYTVTITNSNSCQFTSSAVAVAVNALPTANIIGSTSFCAGSNTLLGLNATAGSGSITDYQWNLEGAPISGATAAGYSATVVGSYSVTITNSHGCLFTSTAFALMANALPAANITGTASFCTGGNTLLSSNATAGSGSISDYQWNLDGTPIFGAILSTYTATAAGSYTVTITNSNGCSFTSTAFAVSINALPSANITGTASFCTGGNTLLGSNETSGSGSITNYQWELEGTPITGATAAGYSATAVGSYTVTITNSHGCSFTSTAFAVTVNALPTASISGTASFCTGGNTLLTSNASAGSGTITDYLWNLDGTPINGATTASFSATTGGSYTVTITNSHGCAFTSTAFAVAVNALPIAGISGTAAVCSGGNTLLSSNAIAGSGSITNYQWNLEGTPIIGATVTTYSATAAGSYTVTITNSHGCSLTSNAFSVTVNSLPTANISGTASFCTGGNTLLVSNGTAGSGSITNYQWDLDGTPVSGATAAGYSATAVGSYTVTITNSNGCSVTSTAFAVTVNELPSANITGKASFCAGGNTLLTSNASAGSGSITNYQWNLGGVPISGATIATYSATAAGSYTVAITNSHNCSFTSTLYAVTTNALPTASITGTASFCTGGNTLLSSNATAGSGSITNYQWNLEGAPISGATAASFSANSVGSYTVTVTNSNGCAFTSTAFAVTINALPTANISGLTSFCAGGNTLLSSNATTGSGSIINYQWNLGGTPISGAISASYSASVAGSYTATIINSHGCSFTSTPFSVSVNTIPTATISGIATFCAGGNTMLSSNAAAGSGSITNYQWNLEGTPISGSISSTYTTNAAGSYTVTITNSNGCSFTSNAFAVTVNALPTASISGTASICTFGNTLLSSNATAGSGSITNYQWNLGGSLISGATAASYPASTAGSYTATITNNHGCSFTSTPFSVTVYALPTASISGTASFCTFGNTILTSTATAGSGSITNYQWNLGGTPISGATATTYTATSAGLYTITISNSNGCSFISTAFAVTVNALPTATISGTTSFCSGGNTMLSSNATAGSGSITNYQWNLGGTPIIGAISSTYTATLAGSYTVTITNSNGCSFTSNAFAVTVNALPTANISGTASFCTGGNTLLTSNATAGSGSITNYQWNLAGTPISGANAATYTAIGAGSYTTTITNSNGCSFTSMAFAVVANALPVANISGLASFCSGGNTLLTSNASAGSGSITTYQWNLGGAPISGATSTTYLASAAGSYTVTITNSNGCSFTSTPFAVTVNALPISNISGLASFCTGGNTLLTSNATAGSGSITSYQWNSAGTPISGATSTTYLASAAGSYTVTIANSNGCSYTSTAFAVIINALPVANISGLNSFCTGGNTLLTSNATAGSGSITSYQWNFGGTFISGATAASYSATAAGAYTVTIVNSHGCSFTSSAFATTVNALPAANITGTASFCTFGTTILTSNATPGSGAITNYQWNLGGTPISGATAATYTATSAGSYTITISNSNGCSFTSTAFTATVNALPTANISGTASICFGGNTLLTSNATAGSGSITNYQWNLGGALISGATSASYSASIAGSYSVTITNSNCCSSISTTFAVKVNALPTANISGLSSFCNGGSTLLTSNASDGSGSIVNYQWNLGGIPINGATASTYTATAAGSYTVSITNSNNCSFTSTAFTVTVNALPSAIISGTASFCAGSNTLLTSNAIAGSGSITKYQWNLEGTPIIGATAGSYSAATAGSYTVSISNSNACSYTATAFVITVNAVPVAPTASVTTQPTCTQPTGTIIITSSTTGLTFNLDGTSYATYPTGGYTLLSPGLHTLAAQNTSNCISLITNITIDQIPNGPNAVAATPANASCGLSNGTITLGAVTGGSAPYNYSVDASAYTASTFYSGIQAGPHGIQVRDANGCIFSTNVIISSASGPTAIAATPTNSSCGLSNGTIVLGAVSGGSVPFAYSIDASAYTTSTSYSGLAAGSHSIQVRDANGCIFSTNVIITNASGPTAIAATSANSSCGLNNGTIELGAVTGGSAPFIYSVDASAFTSTKSYSGLAAGSHSIQVRDVNACIFSIDVTITNSIGPTAIVATPANSSCGLSNGAITLGAVTDGSAPFTYSVDASAYTASTSYTGKAAGSHTVKVRDANGCILSTDVTIINASGPTAIAVTPANSSCGLSNGTITLGTVTGGSAPFAYSVDASSFTTSTSYTGKSAGSHTVQVRDANGCIFSTDVTITNANGPTAIVATPGNASCGLSNGTITLGAVTGGSAPFAYSVDASAFTASTSYSGKAVGSHSIQVRDANGCVFATIVTVSNSSGPTAIAATPANASCGLSNGTISIGAVTGGSAPFTFSVDASAFTASTSYTGKAAGSHNVQVRDANGCIFSVDVTITNASGPSAIVTTPANASCGLSNGAITLGTVTGGSAPFTYSVDASAFTTSTSYNGKAAGSYTVQVKDANGCIFSTDVILTNASGPTAIAAIPTNASCGQSNGTITLGTVTGGSSPYSYSVDASAFTASTLYSGKSAGSHSIQVKDANGCIFSTSVTISNANGPNAIIATPANASCGLSNGTITLGTVTGGSAPFTYSVDASVFTASTLYSGKSAGSHSIQVKDANGCIYSTSVTINNANGPTAIATTPANASCGQSNGTITLGTVTGGSAPFTYSVDASAFTSSTMYLGKAAGSHSIQVKDATGCIFSTIVTISNANGPTAIAATPANASCGQSNGTITLGTVSGGSAPFTYSVDASAFTASTSYSGKAAGSHSIQVRDVNGCIFATNVTITNANGPTAIAVTPVNASCGLSNGTIALGAVTGGSVPFTYSVDASVFTVSTSYSGLAAGSHSIQVKDANGCIFSTSATITQSTNTLEAPIIGTIIQPSCTITMGSVELTGLPALNWTINPGEIKGTGSFITISGLVAGTYSYTVTNSQGCISQASHIVSIINAQGSPTAPIVGTITQPSCTNSTGSVELSGLPALNWTLNPGETKGIGSTTTIAGLSSGTYNFIVTNSAGCISTTSANVVIKPSPSPTADFSFSLACQGIPTYFLDHSNSDPTPLTYWGWVVKDNLQTIGNMTGSNPTFTFENESSYSVIHTVTNSAGCSDSKTYKITVSPSPLSVFNLEDNYENVQGKILLKNGSVGADEYFWDFGNNETSTEESPVVTFTENGDFLIQLFSRNTFGCVDSSSLTYKMLFKGLWVPNAITVGTGISPVGIWKPAGENLSSYKAEIYDRWGKLLWSSDKLVNGVPSEGWDGSFEGKSCMEGTYLWKISATFKDGSVWPNANVDYRQNLQDIGSGTITLIR